MREMIQSQLALGVVDIAAIQLDPRTRDDIPRLLRGLQYIYLQPQVREEVFTILREVEIRQVYEDYLALAASFLARARVTRLTLIEVHRQPAAWFTAMDDYVAHAERQIDQVAIPVVTELAQRFPTLRSVSLDKGFHRPANQERLAELVPFPVLPKKGKCTASEARREADPQFRYLRRRHSAVESAINALEAHGLDGLQR